MGNSNIILAQMKEIQYNGIPSQTLLAESITKSLSCLPKQYVFHVCARVFSLGKSKVYFDGSQNHMQLNFVAVQKINIKINSY